MKQVILVWKLLRHRGKKIIINCSVRAACASFCALSISLLSRAAINGVVAKGGPVFTAELGLLLLITAVLFVSFALSDYRLKQACINAQNKLKSHVLFCMMQQGYIEVEQKTENVLTILENDVTQYVQLFQRSFPELMSTVLTALIMIAASFWMSPAAAIITLICCAIFSISLLLIRKIQMLDTEARDIHEEITGLLLQIHKGLPIFHLFQGTGKFLKHYVGAITKLWIISKRKALITAALSALAILTNSIREFGVIIFVIVVDGSDLGTVSAMLNITSFINGFVVSVIMEIAEMSRGVVAAKKIQQFCDVPWEDIQRSLCDTEVRSVSCENVCFTYPSGRGVSDVSFTASVGSVLGVYGKIGSGKTTLVNVLSGLYSPSSGTIRIDGNIVEKATDLRRMVSVMDQQSLAIPASIAENITMFSEKDNLRLYETIETCGLLDWMSTQEEGPDTFMDPDNLEMSGGQSQRLALARALYRNANILILDEPSAALDQNGVDNLFETLEKLKKDRIIIVVTHDKRIASFFDQTIYL